MNNCRNKMIEMMLRQDTYIYFHIDFVNNQWHLENNPLFTDFTMSESENPIENLLKNDRLFGEDREKLKFLLNKLKDEGSFSTNDKYLKFQFRLMGEKQDVDWYEMRIYPFFDNSGKKVDSLNGAFMKMNEREIKNHNILNFYANDKNPAIFADIMAKRIKEDIDNKYAVIQFDVIGFKFINDKYGETIGNEILQYINDILDLYCSEEQIYSRLSADVFMVVIPYKEMSDIYSFIRGLEAGMIGYKDIRYSFAFGVFLVEDRNMPTRLMGDSAGLARSSIKGNALENIGFYNNEFKANLRSKRSMEERMKAALNNNEFVMFLQPKYSISDSAVIGAEALVRWIDPKEGIIPPDKFIPVFEKNGFIVKIDEYIWECACKHIRKWIDSGIKPVPISVNVSRVHLTDSKFVDYLNELVEKYDIPKNLLELEITESADNINANSMIKLAKVKGFRLLMDDFGSGYSSLNTLKSTPFDVLKIDRSFFSTSMESQRGQKIISHTISMSKDIGLDLIAEGVETKEQADFLYDCGCYTAQGFFYSRPVPEDMFDKLMKNNNTAEQGA
ncbi:MAG: GGDEF domain-containing phosphodiesterase [Ruminiclostridium sp.]|nr:GGDEF domain-containing phosphodiesterase [Ruminiclostridium sp.]